VDGNQTPRVQSDGSESWCLHGPAFHGNGANCCPLSGYWGKYRNPPGTYNTSPWSMVKVLAGGYYPYRTSLRFGIEYYGSCMVYSGGIFYYGTDKPAMVLTDSVDVGSPDSEQAHGYRATGETWKGSLTSQYEGDRNDQVSDDGRSFSGASEFTVKVAADNKGVCLRRRFDQKNPCQRARVSVDGKPVAERNWYQAWHNPYRQWREDDFDIPAGYTAGKQSVRIKIECIPLPEGKREYANQPRKGVTDDITHKDEWNECYYWVFSNTR